MIRKFNKGDIVLCTKFSIENMIQIDASGLKSIPYVDDRFFNRRAYISKTFKEYMDKALGVSHDGNSLAWVSANNLVLILKAEEKHMR